MRLLLVISILTGLCLLPQSAEARKCVVKIYDHKGSVIEAKRCAGQLTITYMRPRQALIPNGVKSGTMLFTGTEQGAGSIKGYIRDFPPSCPRLAMRAKGSRQNDRIILNVNYAVCEKNCQVARHKAIEMVFEALGNDGPSPSAGASRQVAPTTSPAVRAHIEKWDRVPGISRLARNRLDVPSCSECVPFMINCKQPISSLADLRGKRVRTSSAKAAKQLVTQASGEVVVLPAGEIKEALEQGVIDCAVGGGAPPR